MTPLPAVDSHFQYNAERKMNFMALPALNPCLEDELLPAAPFNDFHAVRHLEKHKKKSFDENDIHSPRSQMFDPSCPDPTLSADQFQISSIDGKSASVRNVAQSDFYQKRRAFLSVFEDDMNSQVTVPQEAEVVPLGQKRALFKVLYYLENTNRLFKLKTERVNGTEVKVRWHQREPSRDHTSVVYHDWMVITRYYRYVKGWNNILTEIFQNYCNIMAANHNCHRYLRDDET
ncbi:hypothetical protein ACFE04_008068 [Oxalis oulophora]